MVDGMEIRRIRASTFKSLYDLEAQFDHLSVVTGPNGAGKSNLVDALTFLSDTYRHGLEFAVSRAGGYENIAHRKTRRAKRAISFEVEVEVDPTDIKRGHGFYLWRRSEEPWPDVSLRLVHRFSFRASSQKLIADFEVVDEELAALDQNGRELLFVRFSEGDLETRWGPKHPLLRKADIAAMVRPFMDRGFSWDQWGRKPTPTELLTEWMRYYNVFGLLADHLANVKVFQLSPHLSRTSGVATPNAELGRHGENLPGAADNLRRQSREGWLGVENAMRSIVPDLAAITIVPTEDRRLAVQFKERGVGRAWNASEVSDGTIQTFALLVALFDSRTSMLIIEEPENAVHPWILRHLIDLAGRAGRQVLFTTHSPVVLDYVSPEIIWLMWMRDGHSHLKRIVNLDADIAEGLTSGKVSIFEVYNSGYFTEGVPRGFVELAELKDES